MAGHCSTIVLGARHTLVFSVGTGWCPGAGTSWCPGAVLTGHRGHSRPSAGVTLAQLAGAAGGFAAADTLGAVNKINRIYGAASCCGTKAAPRHCPPFSRAPVLCRSPGAPGRFLGLARS